MDVPPDAAREEMVKSGIPDIFVEALSQLYTRLREERGALKLDTFEQVVGRKPRTFEAWCRDHISAFQ